MYFRTLPFYFNIVFDIFQAFLQTGIDRILPRGYNNTNSLKYHACGKENQDTGKGCI